MLELPAPVRGGTLKELDKHLRMSPSGYVLTKAWLLAALRPRGPYPVLAFTGEQGTAKSTALRMLRHLVDPNTAPLRAPPDTTRDLYVAAINGHVITLDNVTSLTADVSDALCRLSTGGGFSTRSLYTNAQGVDRVPPFKDFARELGKLVPRVRKDTREQGRRVRTLRYYVIDPPANVVKLVRAE